MKKAVSVLFFLLICFAIGAQTIEYTILSFSTGPSTREIAIALNNQAARGWVLISAYASPDGTHYYVMAKRY